MRSAGRSAGGGEGGHRSRGCLLAAARRPFGGGVGVVMVLALGTLTPGACNSSSPSVQGGGGGLKMSGAGGATGGSIGMGSGGQQTNGIGGEGTGGVGAGGTGAAGTGGTAGSAAGGATADAATAVDAMAPDTTVADASRAGSGGAEAGTATGADAGADRQGDAATGDGASTDPLQVDVYLIGGQSNATGQGYIKNFPVGFTIDTRVSLYHSGPPHLDSGSTPNTWIPLRQASESPDRFGPEIGFGNEIQKIYPSRKIFIIKHAHTGTSLYLNWVPGASPSDTGAFGPQFQVFVATVDGGLKALRDRGLHPVLRAMLWQQGEADADAGGSTAQNYGRNLKAFIERVRQQWNSPGMLFVYGYVYPPPNTGAGRDAVRLGERNVDQDSGNVLAESGAFVVPTDDLSLRANDPGTPLPMDYIHFGSAGQLELGKRFADKVHDHLLLP